ncbi:hypothetical protein D3C72_618270 [compost metagenome]
MADEMMPFEGNLIRAQDYAPCGCQDKPHWVIDAEGQDVTQAKACPGRFPVEPFKGEDGTVLGYQIVKGKK